MFQIELRLTVVLVDAHYNKSQLNNRVRRY